MGEEVDAVVGSLQLPSSWLFVALKSHGNRKTRPATKGQRLEFSSRVKSPVGGDNLDGSNIPYLGTQDKKPKPDGRIGLEGYLPGPNPSCPRFCGAT